MLTVLESCALEYRVRALLERSAQQMSSTLIEDIGVPAACSYQWCRVGFFLIYSFSLLLESALIIRLSCHSFAFQVLRLGAGVAAMCLALEEHFKGYSIKQERSSTVNLTSGLSYSQMLCGVISRINLSFNFIMILILIYVNEHKVS